MPSNLVFNVTVIALGSVTPVLVALALLLQ
jgi:hypothetical protein